MEGVEGVEEEYIRDVFIKCIHLFILFIALSSTAHPFKKVDRL